MLLIIAGSWIQGRRLTIVSQKPPPKKRFETDKLGLSKIAQVWNIESKKKKGMKFKLTIGVLHVLLVQTNKTN